jgi:hypothetical protein
MEKTIEFFLSSPHIAISLINPYILRMLINRRLLLNKKLLYNDTLY